MVVSLVPKPEDGLRPIGFVWNAAWFWALDNFSNRGGSALAARELLSTQQGIVSGTWATEVNPQEAELGMVPSAGSRAMMVAWKGRNTFCLSTAMQSRKHRTVFDMNAA